MIMKAVYQVRRLLNNKLRVLHFVDVFRDIIIRVLKIPFIIRIIAFLNLIPPTRSSQVWLDA